MDRLIQNTLIDLFADHGIQLEADEDWLLTEGEDFPAIRGIWHEGKEGGMGRLDIDIVLDEERTIEESFGGVGGGKAGCRDALDAFARNDFHVVLAACWHTVNAEKVAVRELAVGMHRFTVYVGDFTLRGDEGAPMDIPEDALSALDAAITTAPLSEDVHWIRVFYGNVGDGRTQVEVLLDNEPWTAGLKAIVSADWPQHERYYSLRNLIALVPAD
ncbi:hypothetical protein IM816_00415 [Luteibacter flocculans]|uniref:Uncharacterized protein n=1 Tax=Luteibacter flocculans TaxID=2780091 RepID=A0ABY4T416_9GAMM|nr:DUF6348 family protein [Luteibacter flocculans]URL58642.1 hypothetical protein IM816_00415 [Luteibacter flocculans]